jgi:adenylate cyclase
MRGPRRALSSWLPARAPVTWLALGAWGLALLLPLAPPWLVVEHRLLDWLATLRLADASASPIVIVGIDEASFAEAGVQWPWPRDRHARLVDRLTEAGARVIGLAVLFAESAEAEADRRLAEAIGRSRRVVLAADEELVEGPHVVQHVRVEPIEPLARAAAAVGLAELPVDEDAVVRRLPAEDDAFWRRVLEVAGRAPGPLPRDALIRFTDPARGFRYASYYQALDPPAFLPADFFRDQLVLVGLNVRSSPDPGARQAERFPTPLLGRTGRLMPGVEVQAHILHTAMYGRALAVAPWWAKAGFAAALLALAATAMRTWRPGRCSAIAAALLVLAGLGAWAGIEVLGLWVPPAAAGAGLTLLYVSQGAIAFAQEQALRRRIRQAFGHYVSEHVVEEMIAHPERLRLGGERRTLTLLFADLAGFTSLAERLPPEAVVHILNRCLTEVTRVIVEAGGTVDKFMGDAVMAFWGDPWPIRSTRCTPARPRARCRPPSLASRTSWRPRGCRRLACGSGSTPARPRSATWGPTPCSTTPRWATT